MLYLASLKSFNRINSHILTFIHIVDKFKSLNMTKVKVIEEEMLLTLTVFWPSSHTAALSFGSIKTMKTVFQCEKIIVVA